MLLNIFPIYFVNLLKMILTKQAIHGINMTKIQNSEQKKEFSPTFSYISISLHLPA